MAIVAVVSDRREAVARDGAEKLEDQVEVFSQKSSSRTNALVCELHRRVLARSDEEAAPRNDALRVMAASLLAAAEQGATAWLHHSPCRKVGCLTPEEFRATVRLTLCLDLPEIAQAVRAETPCSCCGDRFTTPALFATHTLCSKHRRSDGGGSVHAVHNWVAHVF